MKFLDPVTLTPQATPSSIEGSVYYDSTAHTLEYYNGTSWITLTSSLISPLNIKGDIWGWDTTNNRVPVGSDYSVLTADSSQALGVNYTSAMTSALLLPVGTTAQEPTSAIGLIRFNSTTSRYEFGIGSSTWINHVKLAGDTMTGDLQVPNLIITSGGVIYPSADSTAAVNFALAGGTTNLISLNTTSRRVNIFGTGSTSFGSTLSVVGGNSIAKFGRDASNTLEAFIDGTQTSLNFVQSGSQGVSIFYQSGALRLFGKASNTIDIWSGNLAAARFDTSQQFVIGHTAATALFDANKKDTVTNAISTAATFEHTLTTANAGAAFIGGAIPFMLADSTAAIGVGVQAARFRWLWTTATHASRASQSVLSSSDSTGERDVLSLYATGTRGYGSVLAGTQTTNRASLGGSLFDHFADAGNTTTTETDLYSDSTAGNTLVTTGDTISATYSGIFVLSATATRELKVYFGGTLIFDSTALTSTIAAEWIINVIITMDTATSVRCAVMLTASGASVNSAANYSAVTGLTLTGSNILKITGQVGGVGAATNDIVAKLAKILWQSAI